ncbi:thiosulfate reductase / polysulfide reductase chain A [Desulfonatronum thiosulfatophilum]|uniref:Thiosulfate reductase / polysulfide reductase chain A n=1 Tax=Desulfonatronum thiosulfatophilum TaxID=617002 RepID=A0A1G6AMK0_9BACT|nr:molybdopterin-dependent oxidoreductase [Desulfonatronum thiosulfatophilum]SDB09602.1 thiosulfate reductase / polysulfide reductase chain A [Desulfonatronum thiosulfatophilum]
MENTKTISRRGFLQASAAAMTAAAGVPALKGLVSTGHAMAPAPQQGEISDHFTACDMCFNRCGMIARVRNGRVVKLDPNPKFLKSRGMLCARGNAATAHIYDPDRLKTPLLRKGARGEGKWQRITWDQAMDHTAEQFERIAEKYTRSGIMFSPGSDMQSQFMIRFAEVFGSYNITSHETLCLLSNHRAYLDTFGETPYPDVLYTKYIIIAGANPYEAIITPDTIDLMEARKNGCKMVVLDPRYTKTAALADEWHPIRPGTDMAFFLALAHVIIHEGLYDPEYAEEMLFGLEEFRSHTRKYSPEWAAGETGIPAEDIRRIAREIAAAAPTAMVYTGRRTSDYEDSTQIRRSMAIVNALLANWDRPGGILASREVGVRAPYFDIPWYDDNPDDRIDHGMAPGLIHHEGSFKLMRDAIIKEQPYPIRGWFTFKTNFMQTAANRNKTIEMLDHLDFIVNADITMTDTAWYSDLVLPSPSFLERNDPVSALQGSSACACAIWRDAVVPAMYESRDMRWICTELSNRLGFPEAFDFTLDEYRTWQLESIPEAAQAIKEDGVYYNPSKVYGIYFDVPLKTQAQKIELYNQRYVNMGLDPMPVYKAPRREQGKFRLVVGRTAFFTHSNTNNALLIEFKDENTLWMHPRAAAGLGLRDGERVFVTSDAGRVQLALRIYEGIEEETVYMATGFGALSPGQRLVHKRGASIAEVLEDHADHISGNMAMHETLVTVSRRLS